MNYALSENNECYKIGEKAVQLITNENVNKMTSKDKLMKAKSLIMVNKKTKEILLKLDNIQNQHFYPLSILDYSNMVKRLVKKQISNLPIMSLDSHDYNFCDFNCKDCLAVDTRNWAAKNLDFVKFDPNHYEKVLKEIERYSKQRGFESIRFEMSGEGNPDMYPYRARIIKYAATECNMRPVYITSGSRLNDETIDALAKYAYYIRISLPGTNNLSYDIYSAQTNQLNKYTFDDSMKTIEKLIAKRKEYGREDVLMIGARTCMRPENSGSYIDAASRLGKMGVDSFQIVKILIPIGEDIDKYAIDDTTKKELNDLNENYKKYGLTHVQIPNKLDYIYYDRMLENNDKPSQCYSSFVSPILYGPNLVICTHWEKIKDKQNSHYGFITGEQGQLENLMCGSNACRIREGVPNRCSSCCAIYDNKMIETIKDKLLSVSNIDDIEFMLTYLEN